MGPPLFTHGRHWAHFGHHLVALVSPGWPLASSSGVPELLAAALWGHLGLNVLEGAARVFLATPLVRNA